MAQGKYNEINELSIEMEGESKHYANTVSNTGKEILRMETVCAGNQYLQGKASLLPSLMSSLSR